MDIFGSAKEFLHIDVNHIIPVQVLFKIRCLCNLKLGKQFSRIAALAVISRQHILCHRLSESSGTADADLLVFSKQTFIGERNQHGLIHINFRISNCRVKQIISWVQIDSHDAAPPFFLSIP